MKRAALVVLLLLHGCVDKNLCQDRSGTCVGVTVRGAGSIAQVDDLHIEVRAPDGDAVSVARADTPMSPSASDMAGRLVDLPVTTAIDLPPGTIGASTVVVQGLVGGRVLSGAESELTIESGAHYAIDLTLAANSPGGVAACPSFAPFCDDFEHDGVPGPNDDMFLGWDPTSPYLIANPGSATLTVSAGLSHAESFRGLYSYFATANTTGTAVLSHPIEQEVAGGIVAVRTYVYVEGPLADVTNLAEIDFDGGATQVDGLFFGGGASSAAARDAGYWQISQDAATVYAGKASPIPYAAWMCVEFVLDIDKGVASIYATDAFAPAENAPPVVQMSDVSHGKVNGFELGLVNAEPVMGVWFDDVAYATQRIGCE
jgi:hypothetical protein